MLMKLKKYIPIGFLTLLPLTAFGKLGSTEAECTKLYGKSIGEIKYDGVSVRKLYLFQDKVIQIGFDKDKKANQIAVPIKKDLKDEDLLAMLGLYAPGVKWKVVHYLGRNFMSETEGFIATDGNYNGLRREGDPHSFLTIGKVK